MAQTVYIRLLGNISENTDPLDQLVEWCVSDGLGRPNAQREVLRPVLETVGNSPVVVLVPGNEVVLTKVDLPIRQRAKLIQAVPYALEEQLAEDVEQLHFAVGEKQGNGETPVFVASDLKMQSWLAGFEAAGITPRALVPDILCLPGPVDDQHWSLLIEGANTLIRTSPSSGFTCDSIALEDYLSLAEATETLKLKVATVETDSSIRVTTLPVQSVDIDSNINFGLEAMQLTGDFNRFNLLQGKYSRQQGFDSWLQPLKFTAALVLLSVVLGTLSLALDHFKFKTELSRISAENDAAIARMFPEIKTLVPGSERIQLERRLQELRGEGSGNGLFRPLSTLSQGLASVGGVSLQELQFRDNTLFMSLVAKDISTLEKLKSHFETQASWSLIVQSANSGSEGVQIRASLEATKS